MTSTWARVPLGKVVELQRGYDLPYRARRPGPVPIISSSGVIDTHAVVGAAGPGVVTGRYGTIGEVFFVDGDYWPLNTTLFVRDFRGNDPLFVSYLLRTIDFHSHSGKSGVPGVNRNDLHELIIPVPGSTEEQRAIAAALGDVDLLIGGLDKLIAKKRALKQAAMQQLLTGRTRLPEFRKKWEVRKLAQLGEFLKGRGVTREQAQGGSLACVRYGEIYTTHQDVIRQFTSWISPVTALTATRLRQGDILFAGSGETKAEIGKCVAFVGEFEAYAGGDIVILRPQDANSVFMAYALNMPFMSDQKASRGQGDAVVHISAAALAGLEITVPTRAEQTAIAAVLSDFDAELAALEARHDKTRALKQGMMQELLTGRIRLL